MGIFKRFGNRFIKKDWGSEWLKGKELNALAQGENLTYPAQNSYLVNRCVNIISQNVPQVPLIIFNPKTGDPLLYDNPAYDIFNMPNEYMTYYDFWSRVSMLFTLYGEVFIYLERNNTNSKVVGMQTIDPRIMKTMLDDDKKLTGWLFNGTMPIELEEVIHIKNNNPYNPWRGLPVLSAIDIELNSDYKAGKYQEAFYKNGAVPSVVITTGEEETTIAEMRKIKRLWEKEHKGSNNAHKTAVLRGGMELEVISLNQQEMDFINSRKFTQEIVSSTFGVPRTMLGISEGNRSIGDTERKRFWKETIKPQLIRQQHSLNRFYFMVYAPQLRCRFDFRKVDELQKDFGDDVRAAKDLFQMGFSRDELNYRFDLGFEEGPDWGATTYVPLNLIPQDRYEDYLSSKAATSIGLPIQDDNRADKIAAEHMNDIEKFLNGDEEKENKTVEHRANNLFEELQSGWEEKLSKKYKIYFYEQRKRVLKALSKNEKAEELLDENIIMAQITILDSENKRLTTMFSPIYEDMILEGQELAYQVLGVDRHVLLNKNLLIDRMNVINGINNTVYRQLKKSVVEGILDGDNIAGISRRIKDVYNKVGSRVTTIARTEASHSINLATWTEYKESGLVPMKKWITSQDERVRENHVANAAQGEIPIDKSFQNGEMYPSQSSVNCRCRLTPITSI